MARRANYGAEKRQRELKKKKKRDEKLERKRLANAPEIPAEPVADAEAPIDATVDETADPAGETQAQPLNDAGDPDAEPVAAESPEAPPEKT